MWDERDQRDVMCADSHLAMPRSFGPLVSQNRQRDTRRLLFLLFDQVRKIGEGREGRKSILLSAWWRLTRCVRHLIPLVLIVVTIKT